MALDGAFLSLLAKELREQSLGARVEKIHQPSREELIFALGGKFHSGRLLLSARGNSPRVHFTDCPPENPPAPPMFCMLLRKYLTGAKVADIRQPGLERVLFLDFDTANELGDRVRYTIAVEIMARHSNIILIGEDGKIVDSVRRVDAETSSVRLVLPGVRYELPPGQDKVDLLEREPEEVLRYLEQGKDLPLAKALLSCLQGASPIVCRELSYLTVRNAEVTAHSLTEEQKTRLLVHLRRMQQSLREGGKPVMVCDTAGKPLDFTYMDITQYGLSAVTSVRQSYSRLLDDFYAQKDLNERMRQRSQDLLRVLTNASERIARKLAIQEQELQKCADRDTYRIYGELINANLYQIPRGASSFEAVNFYDEAGGTLRIPLDPALTPGKNAQKYFKEYRKAETAERMLTGLMEKGRQELSYIDSVFDALSRATLERELGEIREELAAEGYIRLAGGRGKRKAPAALPPYEYRSEDGFTILVGRNNVQNDRLTLKTASNQDIWFHTKNIPGSHTVIVTEGTPPPERTILQAAALAALHSKAADSSQVPVDYTEIRRVHKPSGAKPGFVIYEGQSTVYVTPGKELAERLRVK